MRYGLHYTSKKEQAAAMAGKAGHKAFKAYFAGEGKEKALIDFDEVYAPFCVENPPQEERLSYQNVADIMEEWLRMHEGKTWPFVPVVEQLEKGVKVVLCEGIEFFALIDMPVRTHEGSPAVADHKTTGRINDWWLRKFRLASQLTGYAWALGVSTGEDVERVFVNVLELPKLPEPSTKKCRTHGVAYEECRLKHFNFQLTVMSRSEAIKHQWLCDAKLLAQKFLSLKKAFTSVEFVPYLDLEMEGAFNNGCTFCEFQDWCRTDRTPGWAEQNLVKQEWSPWEEGGEE
jgi:hypothetical protein